MHANKKRAYLSAFFIGTHFLALFLSVFDRAGSNQSFYRRFCCKQMCAIHWIKFIVLTAEIAINREFA